MAWGRGYTPLYSIDLNVLMERVPFSSQSLLKKHGAFESDLEVHRARVGETEEEGKGLISDVCPV